MSGRSGAAAAAGLVAVAVLLALGVASSEETGEVVPTGSSATDTGPAGLSGWWTLLRRSGSRVDALAEPPSAAGLDPDTTAIVIQPPRIPGPDAAALRGFVEDGGRLVLGGRIPRGALDSIAGSGIAREPRSRARIAVPLVPAPEVSGVALVRTAGEGSFADAGGALPILGARGDLVAAVSSVGSGQVVLVADPSPLQNRLLGTADNARLALDLVGTPGRPVEFVEVLGAGGNRGIAALPASWIWAFVGLVAAALVLVAARVRRLGPPDQPRRALPPPRRAYVDAIAAGLARTRAPGAAAELLRGAARERLQQRAGTPPDAPDAEVRRAAIGLGLDPEEADALVTRGETDENAIAAGRALARLASVPGRR